MRPSRLRRIFQGQHYHPLRLGLPSDVQYLDAQDASLRPLRNHPWDWLLLGSRESVADFVALSFAFATNHGARNLEGAPKIEEDSIFRGFGGGDDHAEAGEEEGEGSLSVRNDRR